MHVHVRKAFGVAAALAALGIFVAAPRVAQALPAPASSPAAGPSSLNLGRVTVSRAVAQLTFAVRLAAPAELAGTRIQIMLDVDRNPFTGVQGSEFALDYSPAAAGGQAYASLLSLRDWQIVESRPASLEFKTTPSSLTFHISPVALGNPASFAFWVFAARGNAVVDTLPAGALNAPNPRGWRFPSGAAKVTYSDAGGDALSTGEMALAAFVVACLAASIALVAHRASSRRGVPSVRTCRLSHGLRNRLRTLRRARRIVGATSQCVCDDGNRTKRHGSRRAMT